MHHNPPDATCGRCALSDSRRIREGEYYCNVRDEYVAFDAPPCIHWRAKYPALSGSRKRALEVSGTQTGPSLREQVAALVLAACEKAHDDKICNPGAVADAILTTVRNANA